MKKSVFLTTILSLLFVPNLFAQESEMSAEEIQRAAYELSWGRMTESGKLQAFSVLSGEESWQFFVAEMALTYLGGDDLGFPRPLLVEEILKRVAFPILGNESVPVALQQSVATFVLQEIQSESDPSYLTAERRTLTMQWLVRLFGTDELVDRSTHASQIQSVLEALLESEFLHHDMSVHFGDLLDMEAVSLLLENYLANPVSGFVLDKDRALLGAFNHLDLSGYPDLLQRVESRLRAVELLAILVVDEEPEGAAVSEEEDAAEVDMPDPNAIAGESLFEVEGDVIWWGFLDSTERVIVRRQADATIDDPLIIATMTDYLKSVYDAEPIVLKTNVIAMRVHNWKKEQFQSGAPNLSPKLRMNFAQGLLDVLELDRPKYGDDIDRLDDFVLHVFDSGGFVHREWPPQELWDVEEEALKDWVSRLVVWRQAEPPVLRYALEFFEGLFSRNRLHSEEKKLMVRALIVQLQEALGIEPELHTAAPEIASPKIQQRRNYLRFLKNLATQVDILDFENSDVEQAFWDIYEGVDPDEELEIERLQEDLAEDLRELEENILENFGVPRMADSGLIGQFLENGVAGIRNGAQTAASLGDLMTELHASLFKNK